MTNYPVPGRLVVHVALTTGIALSAIARSDEIRPVEHVPPKRLSFQGYGPNHFETTFWELRPQRLAPKNTYTGVGVPGWPVTGFGSAMRARYSEFDLRFTLRGENGEQTLPYNEKDFRQSSPNEWQPGIVSQWTTDGVLYRVTFVSIPHDPKPVDLYRIELTNPTESPRTARLLATLDGAPTLAVEGDLVVDRGKPLVVLDPKPPVERIARPAGVVDPRTTASCSWGPGTPVIDKFKTHRTGWYGMPIEYLLRPDEGKPLEVFVGLANDWVCHDPCWDIKDTRKDPAILRLYEDPGQEVDVHVEGDAQTPRTKAGVGQPRRVLQFLGRDDDGDGYIRVSVRATPASEGPAVLAMLWAFDEGAAVPADELAAGAEVAPVERIVNELYDAGAQAAAGGSPPARARYVIDVGADLLWGVSAELANVGKDPTVFAQQLNYEPTLAPGETKSYLLRLPAIDRPEPEPYGWLFRPYDTKQGWMRPLAARHPENGADYGRDVPRGTDPAEYAAFGPQPRALWEQQLAGARALAWDEALVRLAAFWESFVAPRAQFITPEPYLDLLYKRGLADLELHRQKLSPSDHEVQLVGPDWYWDHCQARDLPYMLLAWELAGYPQAARSLWHTVLTAASELPESRWNLGQWEGDAAHDGLWLSRDGQWSGQGQALWGFYNHYLFTGDGQWLADHYGQIRRGAEWIVRAIQREKDRLGDPEALGYGTLPEAGPEDGGPGHNYYVNAFNVLGLESAAGAADAAGHPEDAARWRAQSVELRRALHEVMRRGFYRFNDFAGTLPAFPEWFPGPKSRTEIDGETVSKTDPDTAFGTALVWPTDAVAPFNPMMHGWYRNREHIGARTAGLYAWPYIQAGGAISYIRRGEPDRAADWFYAFVNHASGTLEWGEGVGANAEMRDIVTGGQMPHCWATGMYIAFLRHLMLMEEGDDTLHVAPATPRHWLAQPKPIGVQKAPTFFGPVDYTIHAAADHARIEGRVKLDSQRRPKRLIIHVRGPGGRGITSATVNGQPWPHYIGDAVILAEPPEEVAFVVDYRQEFGVTP